MEMSISEQNALLIYSQLEPLAHFNIPSKLVLNL